MTGGEATGFVGRWGEGLRGDGRRVYRVCGQVG